ncbi:hypothetical protein [Sphingobacterium bovisgrunnientis]|uniref:hypothetical protein n=1 Tax=Sphingobacterium bovisgrunnientis TaxID=1874697 RepID=UPI001356BA52|nr:hypothetical protein [Sphingobacterium bovisgrunnientis]
MYKIPDMNGLLQMTLLDEILLQARIAIRAFDRLNAPENSFDQIEIWGSIQSVLVASGNVSKILWPSKKYRTRGKLLREYLNIPDNHILAPRVFRNHFEHFDERVEVRFNNSPTGVYIDRQMNPSFNNFLGDREPTCQRGYNTFNHTLIFDGEVLDVQVLIKALKDLVNYMKFNKLALFIT